MSGPAFQLTGDRYATAATYGTTAYGTTPYGGSAYPAYELPAYHFGSDDLTESHRKVTSEIVHYRDGLPVSVRSGNVIRRWLADFKVIDEAELPSLQVFHAARTFNLLPTGDPDIAVLVRWVGQEFAPVQIRPGKYALSVEIEEILQ